MKFYRCPICGKIIAIVDAKPGIPTICCGRPMEELEPNTQDGAYEKHIPVYEVKDNVLTVKVGSVEHPMMDNHYIQWIAVQTNMGNKRAMLKPGEKPEARFALLPGEEVVAVLEYCNLHGLYQG